MTAAAAAGGSKKTRAVITTLPAAAAATSTRQGLTPAALDSSPHKSAASRSQSPTSSGRPSILTSSQPPLPVSGPATSGWQRVRLVSTSPPSPESPALLARIRTRVPTGPRSRLIVSAIPMTFHPPTTRITSPARNKPPKPSSTDSTSTRPHRSTSRKPTPALGVSTSFEFKASISRARPARAASSSTRKRSRSSSAFFRSSLESPLPASSPESLVARTGPARLVRSRLVDLLPRAESMPPLPAVARVSVMLIARRSAGRIKRSST
mmetsp:Transcript_46250/g.122588  ORF Transcript_46250/g.122588 Transcript_46250/m.122588 type:complete len:266 (+) Transcript_46250:1186-1983(+)